MDIQALKNKFLYGQAVKFYGVGENKEEPPTPQPTPKSSKMSVKEIADRLMTLDSTLWDRLKIESGSQLYADDNLQKSYIKYWTEFYEGDTSIPTKMKELSMAERNDLADYFEDDNYHSLKNLFMLYGYFGIDNKKSSEAFYEKYFKGLNPKNFKPEQKKEENGSEEEIKKAIAALEILAEDGDEDAKKGIEALKILLN